MAEFRVTLGSTFLPPSCLRTGILHLHQGQSGKSLCHASGDKELAQITVLKLDLGKINDKSIKETEGSLSFIFDDNPTKVEEICYVSKEEHGCALKLGRDGGMWFLSVQLKYFVLSMTDNLFFFPPVSLSLPFLPLINRCLL